MKVVRTIPEMQSISNSLRSEEKKIALVPTMGYFHAGHISLMKKARELADVVITSLFVNPTQFAPNEDFADYPRDFEKDSEMAEEAGTDFLFYPELREMYPEGYNTEINISGVTKVFEGLSRPTHFNGVATVVAKLFNATLPHIAVFGQKDYQQTLVLKKLVCDLNFDIKIVIAPTVRESDGLAMSSRNTYLLPDLRKKAGILFEALENARTAIEEGERNRKIINAIMHKYLRSIPEIKIDYACAVDADSLEEQENFNAGQRIVLLIAVYLGKTRLIDNMTVSIPAIFPPMEKQFKEGI